MKRSLCFVFTVTALVWSGSWGSAEQAPEFDLKQAKKACEVFTNAIIARDMDALVKATSAPWYDNLDKSRIVLKREDLDQELKKLVAKIKAPPKVVLEFKEAFTYELVLEKFGDQITPEERKLLDKVLRKNDYVLQVEFTSAEGERLSEVVMLVGLRDGQAKVVGLRGR